MKFISPGPHDHFDSCARVSGIGYSNKDSFWFPRRINFDEDFATIFQNLYQLASVNIPQIGFPIYLIRWQLIEHEMSI